VEIVRELLRHGAPLEVRDTSFQGTPLGWALHGAVRGWRHDVGDFPGAVVPPPRADLAVPDAVTEVLRRHAATPRT
jgi:hypothetical protein